MGHEPNLGGDVYAAIDRAVIKPLLDRTRKVSTRMLKRVLNFFASFPSGKCWLTIEEIAVRLQYHERTIRSAIRALVAVGFVNETGRRGRRTRSISWDAVRSVPSESEPVKPAKGTVTKQSDWELAEKRLAEVGLARTSQAAALAQSAGMNASELAHLADVVELNASLQPGSIISRLRDGVWPVDDVIEDPEAIAKARQAAEIGRERVLAQQSDLIRTRTIREARKRKRRPQRDAILAVTARRLRSENLIAFATADELEAERLLLSTQQQRILFS